MTGESNNLENARLSGDASAPAATTGASENLADSILNAIADEVSIIDVRDFTVVDANHVFVERSGLTRAQVLGRPCHLLTHGSGVPCGVDGCCCPIAEMLRTGAPAACEHEHLGPLGARKYVSVSVSPLRDASGTIVRAIHVARDVTAHKRGLEAIAATEARSTAMIDNLPFLVWLKDTGGRFVAVNSRFARSCGKESAVDVVGKTDLDIWPRELAEQYRADDAEVMRRGEQKHVEEPIAHKGVVTWFETFKAPVYDDTGKLLGTTGFSRDITERKTAEEERRRIEAQVEQSHKMEAVGQLAGGVAHDFNNLLSLIISYADFALDELPVESPVRADVLEVKKAGERAAGLTRQLLAFSRKQVIERRRINTNDAVNSLTKMLRRLIGENITFELDLAPDARAIFVDPVQLDQLITNIAINARDAMPGGGKLVVSTRNVAKDERRSRDWSDGALGDYVLISISDTGTGIPTDILGRIFEPFFTTKERGKGTGLGLSMVYGAVQQNGGHLSVDSEVGRGTTFHVYLPAADPGGRETVDADSVAGLEGKGETLLVVEDDDAVRRALVRILRTAGYRVMDANGGAEALALFGASAGTIALVITDVVMPGMSGPTLAAALERLKPEVEILFCSGYPDDLLTAERGLQSGTRLISKPVEKRALLQKVREILDA